MMPASVYTFVTPRAAPVTVYYPPVAARCTPWLLGEKPAQRPDPAPDMILRSLDELLAYLDVL